MSIKRLKALLVPAFLLLLLFIASFLLFNFLIQKPSVQRRLLDNLSDTLEYDLDAENIQVSLIGGLGISADNLAARSRSGPGTITASKIRLAFDVAGLFKGQILPAGIYLSQPAFELDIKEKTSPVHPDRAPSFTKELFKKFAGLDSVVLEKAQLQIKDLPYRLEGFNLRVVREKRNPGRLQVNADGKVAFKKGKATLKFQGVITEDPDKDNDPFAEITLKTEEIPLNWISWPGSIPIKEGYAGANITFKRFMDGALSAEGEIATRGLCFLLSHKNRKKNFCFPRLSLGIKAIYAKSIFNILSLNANAPDFSLHVSTKFDFQDKTKPHIVIKAESPFMPLEVFKKNFPAPILPQWIQGRLFPILRGGDVRLDLFSLAGTAKQIKGLDLPENSDCFLLQMSWKDLDVLDDERALPFKGVSGKLAIENRALEISEVRSNFGDSAITNGSLHVDGLYDEVPAYCVEVEGSFDLKDLKQQSEISFVPLTIRNKIEDFENVSGNLDAYVQVVYDPSSASPQIAWGEFRFKDCTIEHTKWFLPLLLTEADYRIGENGKRRFWGKGLWGKSQIQVTGSADPLWESGNAEVVALVDMNEVADCFYIGDLSQLKFSDQAKCKYSLVKKANLWSCRGKVDLEGLGMDMPSFSVSPKKKGDTIAFDFDYLPGSKVSFRQLSCSLGTSSLEFSGSYDVIKKDFMNLETKASLILEDLGIIFKKGDTVAKGAFTCQMRSDLSLRRPSETFIKGEVTGKDLAFVSSRLAAPVSNCNFKVELSGQEVSVPFLKMLVGHSPIHMTGHVKGWDGLLGKLVVKSKFLDLADFIGDTKRDQPKKKRSAQSRFIKRSNIALQLEALKGQWKRLKYGPFNAECDFRSGNLYIRKSNLQMKHGTLSLQGHIKRGERPDTLFSAHIKLIKQPVKDVLDSFGVEKMFMDGLLTMGADIRGRGKDTKGLVSALKGNADVLLEKGNIMQSSIIFEVLHFLDLQKIFKKRPPDISKEGLYYEAIKMNLGINRGIISTNDFTMKSPVFNAAGKGSLDLPRNWIDFDLGTQPLGTIDFLVSKIPVIGYILTGKKRTLLMYYFKIKGPLHEPKVQYVPLKNLGKSMLNFFKRLLLTPVRLLQ